MKKMPNSSYSTIVFDLGEVVLKSDHPYHTPAQLQEFSDYFKTDLDSFSRGWDEAWPDFRVGKITEEEFWKRFLDSSNSKVIDISFAKKFYREHQKPIEKMLDLLKRLKAKYKLAALSTISKEWLDFKAEKFKLDNFFDVIVGSGYIGIAKPDPEIYRILIEKLSVPPSSCIFVDDAEKNMPPAKDMGITTILFRGQKKLEKDLKKLGII